jgi:natural resistance-associated macrophage protein
MLGYVFQCLTLRLGVITGRDLAQLCRQEYPRTVSLILWIMTEIAIIGSDIQEVVGTAIAIKLLTGLPLYAGVLITAADTFTFLLIHYFGVRKLEAFFALLVTIMAVSFWVELFIGQPDVGGIIKGTVIPTVPSGSLTQAVGMLGAVIMPHNMFLHSALVQSRRVDRRSKASLREANFYFSIEAAISLLISFFINLAVVAVFAKGFYGRICYDEHDPTKVIDCAVGLSQAGDLLGERFGKSARIVWAVGLLAAGQSSTMTGTFAGQYVMQGFLNLRVTPWVRTLFTRCVALVPALIVAIGAKGKLDDLDEFLNILQSIQLPFALLPVLVLMANPRIVGEEFAIKGIKLKILSAMIVFVIAINIFLTGQFVSGFSENTPALVAVIVAGIAYLSFVSWLGYTGLGPLCGRRNGGVDRDNNSGFERLNDETPGSSAATSPSVNGDKGDAKVHDLVQSSSTPSSTTSSVELPLSRGSSPAVQGAAALAAAVSVEVDSALH